MKIAHIVCVFPPYGGGIGTAAYQFALLNAQAGHQVTVFTPLNKNFSAQKDGKIKVRGLRPFLSLGKGAILPQLFWQLSGFDLIILHYPFFGTAEIIYLALVFKKIRQPVIIYYHMDTVGLRASFKLLAWPSKIILPALFKRAKIILAASFDYLKQSDIAGLFFKFQPKFKQLPFAVDTDIFQPLPAVKRKDFFTILFVGGLDKAHYFKGLDVLLSALSFLPADLPVWRLQIVGHGDLRPHYESLARQLGLQKKVEFLGSLPFEQLAKVYAQADIFVLPSVDKSEAFGIVLLEAMASGLPVIAPRLAGVRQVFVEGEQGFLFAPKQANELSQKIAVLLKNNNLRQRLGYQARRYVEKHYSLKIISKKLEEIIYFITENN